MLHAIVTPNVGRPVVHHFQEGAAVWGQEITPSIAHIVQLEKELPIGYSRVAPGIVFEIVTGAVFMPHVIDSKHFRFHADMAAFHQAGGALGSELSAVLSCDVGADCMLKLWGNIASERSNTVSRVEPNDRGMTLPVSFRVTFWEIARFPAPRMRYTDALKGDRIQSLEAKVALSMCSQ